MWVPLFDAIMRSQLQTLAISLSSAVVGALLVSWFQTTKVDKPRPAAPSPPLVSPRQVETRVLSTGVDPELSRRLSSVEQQLANRAEPQALVPRAEPPLNAADDEAEELEHRATREANFSAQPVDPAWAPAVARSFQADFGAFEGANFRAGAVDCRTNVCVVPLTWDSYAAATAQAKDIVQHGYANNCTREILTPAPEGDPRKPYTATVYFDCGNIRK